MQKELDGGEEMDMIKTDCIIKKNIFRKRKTLRDKIECQMYIRKQRVITSSYIHMHLQRRITIFTQSFRI